MPRPSLTKIVKRITSRALLSNLTSGEGYFSRIQTKFMRGSPAIFQTSSKFQRKLADLLTSFLPEIKTLWMMI
jgi:hypothetical protein